MQQQHGDDPRPVFSFIGNASQHPRQMPCYVTHTNEQTHEVIRNNLDRSPMYAGVIEGIGPPTARRSRTRSPALPTRRRTRSLSNRKA